MQDGVQQSRSIGSQGDEVHHVAEEDEVARLASEDKDVLSPEPAGWGCDLSP